MSKKRSIRILISDFLDYLRSKNYSDSTINNYSYQLKSFVDFLSLRKITLINQIDKTVMLNYQQHVYYYKHTVRTNIPKQLSTGTQKLRLIAVICFFKYLDKLEIIIKNPTKHIELPKNEKRIPRDVLTPDEMDKLLQLPEMSNPIGYRNRTILELLYSCGIRRHELVSLKIFDIDFNEKILFVRQGKGKKDRLVPVGSIALQYLKQYIDIVRPKMSIADNKNNWLFLNRFGKKLQKGGLNQMVAKYVKLLNVKDKKISCHSFRASMATAMLKNGANLLHIQNILGHARPETTQVYTKIDISDLKKAHNQTHPRK